MNIVLWILAGVLAALFLMVGMRKLAQPPEKLIAAGMGFVEYFPLVGVRLIGLLEVLAAIGLILPGALDIAPILVPLAALGLGLMMIGAAITHALHHEYRGIIVNAVLLVLAAVVAWGRLGSWAF